jgi:5-methyltetrahydrofolate--homocysteine methyltransferase
MEKIQFLDGAMGTMLQAQGLDTLPEIWNTTHPEVILGVHEAYAAAGCDILTANTFGANRLKLHNCGHTPEALITTGLQLAKKAANANTKVALDIGPTGKLLTPVGDLPFEQAVDIFAEMVRAGTAAGADMILIETMSDTYEIKAAILAAKENSSLPIWVTFSPDASGRLLTGADILTAATLIESLGADAVGFNCGVGPTQMKAWLTELCRCVRLPVIFRPNGGMPRVSGDKTVFDLCPQGFARHMKEAAALGGAIFGGCCGTTPQHIGEMVKALQDTAPAKNAYIPATRITSYGQTVQLGKGQPIALIGERINPTGKPRLKQALLDEDMDYICRQALSQTEQGATLLDVNVGLPGIDEARLLPMAVAALQSITSVPLVIDTSDPAAAEAAMRIYNGKPLFNSVNGKEASLSAILPIAKKYGAALVALTLDENIPETAQGRIAVAQKIITAAQANGIPPHDLVIDTLTMTVGTNSQSARTTLDALDYISNQMGVCTVLGLSNISFGLPGRERLNAGFLAMAAARGLSAAIANPANADIVNTLCIHQVLSGLDENCAGYIQRFSQLPETKAPASNTDKMTLYDAVIKGLADVAQKIAKQSVKETDPMDLINHQLIPALDKAGQDFGDKKSFLPQLLMIAAAAQRAFEAIRIHMAQAGQATQKRGKILLATVKGDIHDIGKNIVKTLLENYNYHVIDLGKDVAPEVIVQAALAEDVPLVGLSALMTTTVVHMEETIALLRQKAPHCRVMVGGAVLTEAYAKQIGADFYSPDATGAVKVAQQVIVG